LLFFINQKSKIYKQDGVTTVYLSFASDMYICKL